VHQTVEDGIAQGWITDHLMPVLDRQLAGHECRVLAVAVVEQIQRHHCWDVDKHR